jgi:glycosyltransferase involved in cell wall biosynthesis
MKPFFSVVIPLYNKEKYIKNTLESVFNQTFHDFEIVIVDDGSTDDSLKIVSRFKDDRIIILKQKNKGAPAARNNGIANAKGKYIALLDADDLWYKNHLFELKRLISIFPDAGLYCNNYEIFYTNRTSRPAKFNFNFDKDCLIVNDFFRASIINSVAWTSAVGFTKEKFTSVGGFNLKLRTSQDLDLWIKLALKYKVAFNPIITSSYIFHIDNSLSKNHYNNTRYEFINNFREQEKNTPSVKLYLDINRYAVAIRCILNNEYDLYKTLKKEIDYKNLNFKQKILLNCPKSILKKFKQLQAYLLEHKIYFSAYK